ncbi:MAG: DUF434 domain-containing protein [Spirochaetes bacterium]|nr:DUF434 domain-containing protein [Spirochaetota bacterium]
MIIDDDLRSAAQDYRFLLDGGYPTDAALKLVGDRWRLAGGSRMALYRGVLARATSDANRARIARSLPTRATLCVDGYNVLFTVFNYRRGSPEFLCTDGFLRDAGGAHGRIADGAAFLEAIGLAVSRLSELGTRTVIMVLDAPVSHSADHAAALREALASHGVSGEVALAASADPELKLRREGFIASSDSAIIAAAGVPVFDLARDILEARYAASFPDFGDIPRH